MVKIKMLFRHGGIQGKMEQGLTYSVSPEYAQELIKHGLAELVIEPVVIEKPIHITAKEIGQVRSTRGRFMPRGKKV